MFPLPLAVVVIVTLFATGITQNINIPELPVCAQGCLINAASEQSSCTGADVACLCKNYDFINVVACCISSSCNKDDQTKAINANVKLCSSANVSIPNYLGCSPELASKFTATASTRSSSSSQNTDASSYTGTLQSAVFVPTSGPVATFAGNALFTGSCTSPEYAMVTMDGGGVLEYPWAGCSNDRPDCCPFDIKVGGLLSVCPKDYTTTSNACCPSGWAIHTSSIGNQIPCVSILRTPLAAPSITGMRKRAPVSVVVTTQLYTLKYALEPKKGGLSIGAKAGIAVGVVLAAIFGALTIGLIIQKRKLKNQGLKEGAVIGDGSYYGSKRYSHAGSHPSHFSELPSPSAMPPGIPVGGGFWIPPPAPERIPTPPPPPIPIQELPASTHMNEHHPAFQSPDQEIDRQPIPIVHVNDEPPMSAGLVSPLDEPIRR